MLNLWLVFAVRLLAMQTSPDGEETSRVAFTFADSFESSFLTHDLYYLPDDNSAEHVISVIELGRFQPFSPERKLSGANWIFFRAENPTGRMAEIFLDTGNTTISKIRLYHIRDGRVEPLSPPLSGFQHQRPFKNNVQVFPFSLDAHSSDSFLLYVSSNVPFHIRPGVFSPMTIASRQHRTEVIYAFYYGILLFVLLFSASLALAFKNERIYLYYSFYILSVIVLFLDFNGIGIKYLWPGELGIDYEVVTVSGALTMVFLFKFIEHFLQGTFSNRSGKIFRLFSYGFIGNVALSAIMFFSFQLQVFHFVVYEIICIPFSFAFIIVVSLKAVKKGFKPAYFLVGALFFLLVGLVINLFRLMEWIPGTWWMQHAVQLGNFLEIITLTVGLAYWFKVGYDERQKLLVKVGEQRREMVTEKDRIAQDLHDNIGTQLTSLSLGLGQLAKNPGSERALSLQQQANAAIIELRDTIWIINKDELLVEELANKIDNLLWRLRQNDGEMTYDFTSTANDGMARLRPNQAINLFRIAQEAINNSLKHSKGSRISITLKLEGRVLKLSIRDNGIGFNSMNAFFSDRYGLTNIRKRAADCDAQLNIYSNPGTGTEVILVMPLITYA